MNQETGRGNRKQAAERQIAALAMRRDGKDFDEIATALGYASRSGAHAAVMAALKRHVAENVDDLRSIEGMRLDALQAAVWPAAMSGDVAAVKAAVSISERRSRLYGLDAPSRSVWSMTENVDVTQLTDDELKMIIERGG